MPTYPRPGWKLRGTHPFQHWHFRRQGQSFTLPVNPDDPHLSARLLAYESTGCQVVPLYRSEWKLYKENWELPEGRKIVSRIDDDDVIARDYCRDLQSAAPEAGEWNLMFPVGYVWWRNTAYRLEHPGTQFVTLVTDQQTDPHQEGHWKYS
jgi:hypothetical protein